MPVSKGDQAAEGARREAAAWIARMRGPDAEASRLDFERWRSMSLRNRTAYAEMEQISRLSRRLGETEVGRAHLGRRRRQPFFAWPVPRFAVAGLVIVLLVGGGSLFLLRDRPAPGVAVARPLVLATRVGEIRRVRLEDGTEVTLDTDSEIEPGFTRGYRIVHVLRGRARFDVAASVGRPFMVEAGDKTIVDRGTVFDVTVGRDGVRVMLLRGAVDVRLTRSRDARAAPLARLLPGQAFVEAGGAAAVSPARRGGERWVEGMLSFDNTPLGQVVAEANRYSGHKLVLGEPGLAGLRVSGLVRASPPGGLAAVLAATLGLRVERDGQGDFVLHPR